MASIYSWESFIRIHGGNVGAQDVFEKAMDDLLRAENLDKEVHIVKASQGDGGIDVYIHQENGIDIYQCKFFMDALNSSRWGQIKKSFKKAMEPKGVKVLRWYLCMPREMQKEDIAKWDTFKKEKEKEFTGVELCCIDGSEIISRMEECDRVKNTALMDKYFHENRKKRFTNKDLIIPFTMSKANGAQGGTYVPRDDLLSKIEESFKTERIVFLSGMGGCGKSELARAYGYKHRDDYEEIFWLTCDDGEDGEAPDLMGLMEKTDLLNKIEKLDVKEFSDKVLIIVDNCNKEDGAFLSELENGTGSAHIIVTTRLRSMGRFWSTIPVESDTPEQFAYSVFEQNYSMESEFDEEQKVILDTEEDHVKEICRRVQYNTMFVSLIGIRLREYSDLSITDCEKKLSSGVGNIQGEIEYGNHLDVRSGEIKEILIFLFRDILKYEFNAAQKRVFSLIALTPAEWYEVNYICNLLDGAKPKTSHRRAIKVLLKLGWLQGNMERIAIHPLIAEVLSEHPGMEQESAFFESLLENYLGLPNEHLQKKRFLINIVLKRTVETVPEVMLVAMLLLNHGGYKHLFAELHPEVKAAYFVYAAHGGSRYFIYRDLKENKTITLVEVTCQEEDGKGAKLLKIYNTGVPYILDLNKPFQGEWIAEVSEGICWDDSFVTECIFFDGTEAIGKNAFFACRNLRGELDLPENLKSIGDKAFCGCNNLSGELRLPKNMHSIGYSAFQDCFNLRGCLDLPPHLTSLGDYAFLNCKFTGKLYLPETLKSIGIGVFSGCDHLTGRLRLPERITTIGAGAFALCTSLSGELSLPKSLTRIGTKAFYGCIGFSGELHLPDNLMWIGNQAFYGCIGLCGELCLPKNLISVGESAFKGCDKLTFPDDIRRYYSHKDSEVYINRTSLKTSHLVEDAQIQSAMETCTKRRNLFKLSEENGELQMPNNLTRIVDLEFMLCDGIRGELHFPDSLTYIGERAFCGCTGLSGELRLPESLTEIDVKAFYCCRGLKKLRLSERLASIGYKAFYGCSNLSGEIHIPNSLRYLGYYAFYGCNKIEKVIFHNPNTIIEDFLTPYSSKVIVGYRHSTAEAYAQEHDLVFEELVEEM